MGQTKEEKKWKASIKYVKHRSTMTEEQKEAERAYKRQYYQDKKLHGTMRNARNKKLFTGKEMEVLLNQFGNSQSITDGFTDEELILWLTELKEQCQTLLTHWDQVTKQAFVDVLQTMVVYKAKLVQRG
jgi:hypothetical protein